MPFWQRKDTAEIADERGCFLDLAAAANRGARLSSDQDVGSLKQALAPARDGALNQTKEEILRVQCTGNGRQMGHLQSAMACVSDAETKWTAGSTERRYEPDEMYQSPQIRRGGTHERLITHFDGPASRLTETRLQPYKQGSLATWAAPGMQKLAGREKQDRQRDDAQQDFWAKVEGNEAKRITRKELCKWALRRLREEGRDFPAMPAGPSAAEELPDSPFLSG